MTLNIKDPEAHALALSLAQATGESMTKAVTRALQERWQRVQRQRQPEARAADLLAIGARCAAGITRPVIDHGTLLYDELGLPK